MNKKAETFNYRSFQIVLK